MLDQIIVAAVYPVVSKDSTKFVASFKEHANGGVDVNYTRDPQKAQRFGPEVVLLQKMLTSFATVDADQETTYTFVTMKAIDTITEIFDDGKDYSTVDIAVQISSSFESSMLYSQYKEKGYTYEQDMGGNLFTIGHLEKRPVCIAPMIQVVNGIRILYVEATSDVVCWSMIENWIKVKVGKDIEIITNPANLISHLMHFSK